MAEPGWARSPNWPVRRPRCIHLAGADGTGKTTQARAILAWLRGQGVDARYVWLRHPRLFCVPFLLYARLRGYSWQEVVDGNRHGYWNFGASWVMSRLFPWALLLDTFLVALFGVYVPLIAGRTVVVDRFVIDILADVMVGLNDSHLEERLPGRLFLALLPRGTRIVVLDLDTAIARQRSPELMGDRSQPQRRDSYLGLAERLALPVVSAAGPVEEVTAEVILRVGDAPTAGLDPQPMTAGIDVNAIGIKDAVGARDRQAR